jgi:hypothetical protein
MCCRRLETLWQVAGVKPVNMVKQCKLTIAVRIGIEMTDLDAQRDKLIERIKQVFPEKPPSKG